jgi:biopolymer transport protein ExbD
MASVTTVPEYEDLEEDLDERPEPLVPKQSLEDTEMDITPMIDITFLLLIFFIVSSKMDPSANVPLPPAQTGTAIAVNNSIIITMGPGATDDAPAQAYRGDGIVPENTFTSGDIAAQEEEITAYVEDMLAENPEMNIVLIKASRGIKHRDVARVQTAVSKPAGIEQIYIAVMEAQ